MPHKINCELTDEQLGLLCEVLSAKQCELHKRILDSGATMGYISIRHPKGFITPVEANIDIRKEFAVCTSLIAAIESSL